MSIPRGFWLLFGATLIVGLSAWLLVDRWTDEPAEPSFTSLAVLVFDSPSKEAEQVHLATGLSLDLLLRLQVLDLLQCSPRSQVLAWRDADTPRPILARQLGAEILVFGTVRQESGRILLSLEIEDARDETLLAQIDLAESRERIFDLQRRAALEVVNALQIPLQGSEKSHLRRDPTRSLKAWDYSIQGQGYLEDLTNPRGPIFAADLFRRAIQHDPDFAQAHVGLSAALWLGHVRQGDPADLAEAAAAARRVLSRNPGMSSAAVALAKVLQIGPRSAPARTLPNSEVTLLTKPDEALRDLAVGMLQVGKLELAEAAWRSAADLGSELWLNWYALGQFLLRSGRFGEAEIAFAEAAERSPPVMTWPRESLTKLKLATGDLSDAIRVFETIERQLADVDMVRQVAAAYTILGRLEAAERLYRQALDLDPLDPLLHQEIGDVLTRRHRQEQAKDEYEQGLQIVEESLESSPSDTALQLRLAVLAAKAQDCPRALPLAATLRRHLQESAPAYFDLALVFALCQDAEMAIDSLRAALVQGLAPELVRSQPEFQELTSEAEFQAILGQAESVPPSP